MLQFCEIVFKIYLVLSNSIDFVFLQSLNETYCPDDKYRDDMTNDCKACGVGFYGFNCSKPCRYPNYGFQCQHECDCRKTHCNIKFGCREYYSKVVTESTNHECIMSGNTSTSQKLLICVLQIIFGIQRYRCAKNVMLDFMESIVQSRVGIQIMAMMSKPVRLL
uniref:Uncharacterized protein n=1 Tax=Magallana gigas TaxID=29159 RepID=A0A8W8J8W7_MAGGI